jgi:hypothetical protein
MMGTIPEIKISARTSDTLEDRFLPDKMPLFSDHKSGPGRTGSEYKYALTHILPGDVNNRGTTLSNYCINATSAFRVIFACIIAFVILFTDTVTAQTGGFAGSYSRMGMGPRGMAAGNIFTSTAFDGVYAHYNPALASFSRSNQIDMSSAVLSFDRSLNSVNATFRLPPNAGINAGIIHGGVSDFDGRSLSGYPTDRFSINDYQLFVAFGLNINERLSLGMASKVLHASYFEDVNKPWGFGIDVGLVYKATPGLSIGFAVQDILSSLDWDTSDLYNTAGTSRKTDNFPTRFKFAASITLPETGLMIGSEFEIRSQSSDIIITELSTGTGLPRLRRNTDQVKTSSYQYRLGSVYNMHERVTLRGGLQILDFEYISESLQYSLGFSVHLPFDRFSPSVDYAAVLEPDGHSFMHVFALRLNL